MANKLPWFPHDHDASEDTWIRGVVRRQGHVAGWLWWVLLEQLHKHGIGDTLKMNINDIARIAMTSRSVVTRVLGELATEVPTESGLRRKVSFTLNGSQLELKIEKVRKKWSNLKSKITSKSPESPSKVPIYRDRERDKETDKRTAKPPQPKVRAKQKGTNFQIFMDRFLKECMSIKVPGETLQEKAVVSAHYRRFGRAGKDVLAMCKGDPNVAMRGVEAVGGWLQDLGRDWTLDTVTQHVTDWINNPSKFKRGFKN